VFADACEMLGFGVSASDGSIGVVCDFLFEESSWIIRYLVVNTSGLQMMGRRVLISPVSVRFADRKRRVIGVGLTRDQIINAPGVDLHPTVSFANEMPLAEYFGWPRYWRQDAYRDWPFTNAGHLAGLYGEQPEPVPIHLHSVREIVGYKIRGIDGRIGHVDDFIFSLDDWRICRLIVDTRSWLPARRAAVAPEWITWLQWSSKTLYVSLTRREIRNAPRCDVESLEGAAH
jgi:uncharacterized protein YrrD